MKALEKGYHIDIIICIYLIVLHTLFLVISRNSLYRTDCNNICDCSFIFMGLEPSQRALSNGISFMVYPYSRGAESKTFIYLTTKIQYLLPKKCFAPISLPTGVIVQVEFDVWVPGGGHWVGVCLRPHGHQRCICSDGDGSCHAQMTCFSHKNVIISAVESGEVHRKFGHCKCLCK